MWLPLTDISLLNKYWDAAAASRDVAVGTKMGLLLTDVWQLLPGWATSGRDVDAGANMELLLAEMWMLVQRWGCYWPRCDSWCKDGAAAGRDLTAGNRGGGGLLLAEMWELVPTWGCCWPRCGSCCRDGAASGRDVNAGARDTPYSRSVIPLFSCPLSWSVHYNFSGDESCRIMMEAVVPSWKLSRLLTVAMSKQDFSARKLKCNFFIMVYKSLITNVFTWFCLILNKICGWKSATWPWHMAASTNPIRRVH